MNTDMKYEEALKRLEAIADSMENGTMDIDEMARQLKEAKELVKLCKAKLTKTDEEIKKILDDNDTKQGE